MCARIWLVWVVIIAVGFAVHAEEPKETKFKPTMIFNGTHSAIQYETFDLVTKESGWKELWKKHRGEESNPLFTETSQKLEIDFETQYVVVIFTGPCDLCEITYRQRGDVILIGYAAKYYQIEGRWPTTAEDPLPRTPDLRVMHEEAKSEAKAPYAFVVLPKPIRTVVIERNVQSEIDAPPVWKLRFLFPLAKGQK